MITTRDLLITLGAAFELPRSAVCRLGLQPERLRELPAGARARAALAADLGVPARVLETFRRLLGRAPAVVRREERSARRHGARIVTAADPEYPRSLMDLDLPPPSLYVRGSVHDEPAPLGLDAAAAVAIVGSRRADAYGRESAELFGRELAAAGLTVVSGFARGVDAAAHRGALAAPVDHPGRAATVAVLGSGLGVDYPRGHRRLGDRIAERGALVTEFPCGVEPRAWHFPVRNRLIAALSAATLVVRAAPRSGSLVTARFALDLGRDVCAVPGRIFEERSMGTNALLADGAYPALHPRDVLDLLGVPTAPPPARARSAGSPGPGSTDGSAAGPVDAPKKGSVRGLPGRLLASMTPAEPESPEALAERVGAPVDRVLGALLELELAGRVRREPGPAYVRRP
jgi:DNA processing protein